MTFCVSPLFTTLFFFTKLCRSRSATPLLDHSISGLISETTNGSSCLYSGCISPPVLHPAPLALSSFSGHCWRWTTPPEALPTLSPWERLQGSYRAAVSVRQLCVQCQAAGATRWRLTFTYCSLCDTCHLSRWLCLLTKGVIIKDDCFASITRGQCSDVQRDDTQAKSVL